MKHFWREEILDIAFDQMDLMANYSDTYHRDAVGMGLCFGLSLVIREKISSNLGKGIKPKAIVENFLEKLKAKPTDEKSKYKFKKSLLRVYVNQQYTQGFIKHQDLLLVKELTKDSLTQELEKKVLYLLVYIQNLALNMVIKYF